MSFALILKLWILGVALVLTSCSEVKIIGMKSKSECEGANNLEQCIKSIENPNSLNWVSEFEWGEINESLNDTAFSESISVLPSWSYRLDIAPSETKVAILIKSDQQIEMIALKAGVEYQVSLRNEQLDNEFLSTLLLNLDEVENFQIKALDSKMNLNFSLQVLKNTSLAWNLTEAYLFYKWQVGSLDQLNVNSGYWNLPLSLLESDKLLIPDLEVDARVQVLAYGLLEEEGREGAIFDSKSVGSTEVEVPIAGEYVVVVENASDDMISVDSFQIGVKRVP